MRDNTLHGWAAARISELPGAYLDHPFGPEWDVYKVQGKVFMLQTRVTGDEMTTLKARPADAAELREIYPEIEPGHHMNKRHWITLKVGAALERQFIEDLVTESYLLVVERNVPKSRWPVDPHSFGQQP